jgi:FixJ family two-component response regulator
MGNTGKYEFSEEKEKITPANKPWVVYVTDDDQSILDSTEAALKNYTFKGRKVKLHLFSNAFDTISALSNDNPEDPEVAVIFLDIVMDGNSGFDVIHYLRHKQKNYITQIIMRTGQAGKAIHFPNELTEEFEVDDFIEKLDNTITRLHTSLNSNLRKYELLRELSSANKKLDIINASLMRVFNLTKEKGFNTHEDKRLLIRILFDQINVSIYKGKKQLTDAAYKRLLENKCDNIMYLHTIMSKAIKSRKKSDTITEMDIARSEEEPLLIWKKEEAWLKNLHKALCGGKIGDMQRGEKFIDPATPWEIFKAHHYDEMPGAHINWIGKLEDLIYLYFALYEERTHYIERNGVLGVIHKELALHYLFNGRLQKTNVLKVVKNINTDKVIIPDPLQKSKYSTEYEWVGDSPNKQLIDQIILNLEEE